jgi:hypothetical protein
MNKNINRCYDAFCLAFSLSGWHFPAPPLTLSPENGVIFLWTGILDGAPASTTRNGSSDTFVRVAVNLYGAPPLRGKAFRPQLGITHSRGKWIAELTGEAAFFTNNDTFFNGNTREQEPLYILRGHLIHTYNPGQWASVSPNCAGLPLYHLSGIVSSHRPVYTGCQVWVK